MSWLPIETAPQSPGAVLYYSANARVIDVSGKLIPLPASENAAKYGIGYWDGVDFRWAGSNHRVFEFWGPAAKSWLPTHWMPLPDTPPSASMETGRE